MGNCDVWCFHVPGMLRPPPRIGCPYQFCAFSANGLLEREANSYDAGLICIEFFFSSPDVSAAWRKQETSRVFQKARSREIGDSREISHFCCCIVSRHVLGRLCLLTFLIIVFRLVALRDGKTPPTDSDIVKYQQQQNAAPASLGETVIERQVGRHPSRYESSCAVHREARLRREAEDRLRQKFGEGGLKGQSMGSISYTPEPRRKSGDFFDAVGVKYVRLFVASVVLV